MCGINGFNFTTPGLIDTMNAATAHRGPDAMGAWAGTDITLGHNRLAILDLSPRGAQPMWDAGKEIVIVFNGEIYNFQELRQELANRYTFHSTSDTEVILYAYREWGIDCVKKFNGIFAFALYDTRSRELFLARDHMGVKPLYYYWDGAQLIFSSEIKGILCHPVPRLVDREAFNLFFHVLYVPEPYTMFEGIRKLPAASYLRLRDKDLAIKKYWEVTDMTNVQSRQEAQSQILRLFQDAVERQLISDRPVGVFLSGGIDSTAILGRVTEMSKEKVKTYSVGFDIPGEEEKFNADFRLAQKTAAYYGTDHHPLIVTAKDIADNLDAVAWHLDEPNFNPTAGAIYLLAKEAKKQVSVVLGGDGADELFGGYPRYFVSRSIRHLRTMPWQLLRLLGRLSHVDPAKFQLAGDARHVLAFLSQKQSDLSLVFAPGMDMSYEPIEEHFTQHFFSYNPVKIADFEKHFMHVDRQSWLVDESLLRTDKMTMAFGLEARVPILDYRLVELSMRIPTKWKFSLWQRPGHFQGKDIWKSAVSQYVPAHILHERKRGWFTPMAKWLRGDLRDVVGDMLSPESLNTEFFDPRGVQNMWQDHLSGKRYNLNMIWAIVMWHLWYTRFIKTNR